MSYYQYGNGFEWCKFGEGWDDECWRDEEATERQINYIIGLCKRIGIFLEIPESITKGIASDVIGKLLILEAEQKENMKIIQPKPLLQRD